MSKKLPIEIDGVAYTLQYNRWAIKQIEARGFNVDNLSAKLVTNVELLFQGAFLMNHRFVKPKEIDTLLDKVAEKYDTAELMELLVELYMDAIPVMGDDGEGKTKLAIVEN